MMTLKRQVFSLHTIPLYSVSRWRFIELVLLIAIFTVAWRHYGDRITTTIQTHREAWATQQALLPKGGPVVKSSWNPFIVIPYYWGNVGTDQPLLLPDITPIIGEDSKLTEQYPNMEAWRIDTTTQPGRTLLRINTSTANIGAGPLHIVGGGILGGEELAGEIMEGEGQKNQKQVVYQRIWRADETFTDREAGHFVYHPGHGHIHFDNYAQYVLRLRDADGRVVAQGAKVGFCLTDVLPVDGDLIEAAAVQVEMPVLECGDRQQGINPGYADYYGHRLDGQWLDITDVPWGEYQLQVVVDPNNLILEANEENNRLSMPLTYTAETAAERQ